jgi:Tfp pilus assembly protein PilF
MSLIADSLKKALKAKESLGPKIPQFNLIASKDKLSGKIPDKKVLGQAVAIGILGIVFSYLVFSGAFDKGVKITDLSIWETLGLKSKKQPPIQVAKIPAQSKPITPNPVSQPTTAPVNPVKEAATVEPFVPPQTIQSVDQTDKPAENSNNIETDTGNSNSAQNEPIEPSMPAMEEELKVQVEPVETEIPEDEMSGSEGTTSEIVPVKDLHPLEIKIRRGPKLTAKKYRKNRTPSTSTPRMSNVQSLNEKIKHVVILSPKEFLEQISGGGREKVEMANFSPEEMIPMKSLESTPPLSKTTTPEIFKDSNYYFNMGTFHQEAGDHQEALINYQKAAELDPRNPEIYNNIGLIYKKLRMYDASLEQFMRALYIDPNFSKAYNNIGVVYYKKGNIKGAISNYKKAIQTEPDNLETYNNLGIIYKKQNWLEKAQSVYNKAFKIDSEHPGTNYNLGLLYEEMGNMTSAIYFYRRFIKLGGDRHPKLVTRVKNHLESLAG